MSREGELEYMGRYDEQVKVRGYRIEPQEIESALCLNPAVRDALVLVREIGPGDKRLVAYIIPSEEEALRAGDLRAFLKQSLPSHMIPSAFIFLNAFPLNHNGKLDRQALPAPDRAEDALNEDYVAARSELEAELVRIWEEVLNIKPLGVRDNFFEIGGHSLLAVRLRAQIEKAFGDTLPVSILFQHPTIEELAGYLSSRVQPPSWSPLVAIQSEGSRPPFFCVHPAGGNVYCYVELARLLGQDQPFYAFQARGLDGESAAQSTIEEMAACYLEAMRTVQPEGPYFIGGWSMGGIVAFEMARQLHLQDQAVALLALFDSYAPGDLVVDAPGSASLLAAFLQHLDITADRLAPFWQDMLRLDPDDRLRYVLDRVHSEGLLPSDLGLSQFEHLYKVFIINVRAMHKYVPEPVPVHVTLLQASERLSGPSPRRQTAKRLRARLSLRPGARDVKDSPGRLGWGKLAGRGLDTYAVPGDHFSMMREIHIEALAARLRTCLDHAQAESVTQLTTICEAVV
ncbi:MAG TPA: alpha/beta fold hydrolase [Blastocatellia bacterium]|nr:alpha/beta fold hydrolase [Blastocatellia bacterium]